jgi:hypothetical protein
MIFYQKAYIGLVAILALIIALHSSQVEALTAQTCASHFYADRDPHKRHFVCKHQPITIHI